MVRFLEHATDTGNALRARRGAHRAFFEEGDNGPAFKARCPTMDWVEDADGLSVAYGDFADVTLRYIGAENVATAEAAKFAGRQIDIAPLSRVWAAMQPFLRLTGPDADGNVTWDRRGARRATRLAFEAIPDDERSELVVKDSEYFDRVAIVDRTAVPWNTHGGWVLELDWSMLMADGTFGPAADLLWVCVHSAKMLVRETPTAYIH